MPRKNKKPRIRVIWKSMMFNKNGYTLTHAMYPKNTTRIDREGDYLLQVPKTLYQFPRLQSLNLNCNMIASTLNRLCCLTNLTFLDISMTGMRKLPRAFSKLQNLEELKLEYNAPLLHVCRPIVELRKLKRLSFYECNLNLQIKGEKPRNPHLERLAALPELETLDLSENIFIEELPQELQNCEKLKKICLFNNSEKCISNAKDIFRPEQIFLQDTYE